MRLLQMTTVPRRTAQPLGRLRLLNFAIIAAVLLGTVAVPGAGRAQEDNTTQASTETVGLQGMLSRVPALLPEMQSPETARISYANVAAQLDAVGITAPSSFDDPAVGYWSRATLGLQMPEITRYLYHLRADFGLDLLQVDETLEISAGRFRLTVLRGRFDQAGVLAGLNSYGYAPVTAGSPVLAIGPDFDVDITAYGSYAAVMLNVVTILADGTLVFARARSIIQAVLAVQDGQAESLATRADVAKLLPHVPSDLASGVIVSGQQLAAEDGASTNAGNMPPVALALVGTTVGGPLPSMEGTPVPVQSGAPTSRAVLILLMRTVEDAAAAVPVVESRLSTGSSRVDDQPLTEFFSGWSVRAVPGEPVLLIDLAAVEGRGTRIVFAMLSQRDLVFVAW